VRAQKRGQWYRLSSWLLLTQVYPNQIGDLNERVSISTCLMTMSHHDYTVTSSAKCPYGTIPFLINSSNHQVFSSHYSSHISVPDQKLIARDFNSLARLSHRWLAALTWFQTCWWNLARFHIDCCSEGPFSEISFAHCLYMLLVSASQLFYR
jgi:hypothetical protein